MLIFWSYRGSQYWSLCSVLLFSLWPLLSFCLCVTTAAISPMALGHAFIITYRNNQHRPFLRMAVNTIELRFVLLCLQLSFPSYRCDHHWALLLIVMPTTELSFVWMWSPLSFVTSCYAYNWAFLRISVSTIKLRYILLWLQLSFPSYCCDH